MTDKRFYEDTTFGGGFGLYYIMVWIIAFYPCFIITMTLQRLFFGIDSEGAADVFAVVCMVILTFVIIGLVKLEQYFIVLMLYLLTLWPFLYILWHCWENAGEMTTFPLPLDWCPFL